VIVTEENKKVQIGLTAANLDRLEEIAERGWFSSEHQEIGRFCLAYAIRARVPAGTTSQVRTTWGSGGFDPTGELRAVVEAIYPGTDDLVRLMQHLINEGIQMVHSEMQKPGIGPSQLMEG
jgi:hypothetical protein